MDDSAVTTSSERDRPAGPSWRALLTPPRVVAAAGAVILLAVAISGRISWFEAVISSGMMMGLAVVLERALAARTTEVDPPRPTAVLDPAVETFADILFEPCIVINERSVIVYCNPSARSQFPRMRLGAPLAFTLRDPDVVEAIAQARASGRPEFAEIHQTVPNETWFRLAVVPFGGGGEKGPGFLVLSLYDLTEQRRTDQLRADFVANASHELRTPLTSLMGFIETLQGPAARDEAARTRFLAIMRSQSERMSELVDDLLSLSRIEQRQHVRPTGKVALNGLLREVVEGLELRAREEGLEIQLNLPQDEIVVMGERTELYEVFENLLDNAIKYGADGKTVEITLDPAGQDGRSAHRVVVRDNGPGIPEEHVPRLTERFYRVESETGRKKKGTGLGLAIVKHVVSRHHGELTIRSRLGEGTRVEVLLPVLDGL